MAKTINSYVYSFEYERETQRDAAIKTEQHMRDVQDKWEKMVKEGKARKVLIPELNGYRFHYELINK